MPDQIEQRLSFLYGPDAAPGLADRVLKLAKDRKTPRPPTPSAQWDQRDALLITYGDSVLDGDRPPMRVLHELLREHVGDRLSLIHLLPFYPFTSDDGFSVVDFRKVREDLGGWPDVEAIARDYRLVFDGVINHVSQSSEYAQGFFRGDPRYKDFLVSLPPDTDTRSVLRTRNLSLLHDYDTADGKKWCWTTFSRDQVDLNYSNPEVLLEILDVLLFYAQRGASMIRLDAVPYLWKLLGTSCAHLPQTHQIIRLIRDVFDLAAPHVLLLTETNNPHAENMTYFGAPGKEGEEAQVIYNFTLAPLIVHAIFRGDATVLSRWAANVRKVSDQATYLNITATHDGIGMRPTEGILDESERQALVQLARDRGGDMTGKRNSDGSVSPYELNITYFDAINPRNDDPKKQEPLDLQVDRFMCSQAIALSFIGIPGIYIHSLVGSRNDYEGVKQTGRARSINRAKLLLGGLRSELADVGSLRGRVFDRYMRLLEIRRAEPAFHPNCSQEVLDAGPGVFALARIEEPTGRRLVALHNVTERTLITTAKALGITKPVRDLITGERLEANEISLAPYQVRWLISA